MGPPPSWDGPPELWQEMIADAGFDDEELQMMQQIQKMMGQMSSDSSSSSDSSECDSEETDSDGIGFRAFCDVSQATITFGDWYHKKGEDFDLCEKEYQKLSDAEKEQFVKVDTPEDLGQDLGEYVGDEDDLEDMSPEQILEMISEAFMLKEGRPPTEEEAAAFLKMIDEASGEEDDDNSDNNKKVRKKKTRSNHIHHTTAARRTNNTCPQPQ